MVVRSGLLMGLCGIVAGFPSSPVPLRGSLLRIGPAQRRVSTVPLGLSMNAEKLEKIVVCTVLEMCVMCVVRSVCELRGPVVV